MSSPKDKTHSVGSSGMVPAENDNYEIFIVFVMIIAR